nr:pheromone precursor [Ganoderma boninense]
MDEFFVLADPIPLSGSPDSQPDDFTSGPPHDAEHYGGSQSTFFCVIA